MRAARKLIGAATLGVMMCLGAAGVVRAEGQAGPYLAGRLAFAANDFKEAARYFARAVVQDPTNVELLESAVLAQVAGGDFDSAAALARQLRAADPENQLGAMIFMVRAVSQEDFDTAAELLEVDTINPLVRDLARAWVAAGQGHMTEALEQFQAVAETPGLRNFGLYHKALALGLAGDLEGAEAILSGAEQGEVLATKRMSIARAEILAQLDRMPEAIAVLDNYLGFSDDPAVRDLRNRLAAGRQPELSVVRSPVDGVAEVFLGLASALAGETDDIYALAYARLAEVLRLDLTDARLLVAGLLEQLGQFDLANATYDQIGRDDPSYVLAELGRANALYRADRQDAALEVLSKLAKDHPDVADVHAALGDLLRRMERYDEATKAYDRAIALIAGTEEEDWFIYYTRGITHERMNRWDKAEADFRHALELSPDQPQVLNYLGYSFVEMQTNLDEALEMIEKAVSLRPQDGYITDSLGWVLYRLGRYDEAVTWMEKAAELTPTDPIINDHLGDVYWAVGRKREARFQWNRALSFDPEEKDAARIRRKLEVGLDAVLAEEGAPPLADRDAD